ncbi:MAG: RidA family protein [Candidatus Melainabacteria bacterium]|nr:RidA family protein [Candidatus Melainabacteria bacterium]MBI3308768.1 RidA family protein [Candidatus Melainabacteria bacterium]
MLSLKNDPEAKIKELGLNLPEPPKPVASYVPTVIASNNLLYTSGNLPLENGKVLYTGKMGEGKNTIEIGAEASKLATLNSLSAVKAAVGNLSRIKRVIKVTGFVNSKAGFTDQPKVINGASDLLVSIFGDAGKHARSAVGISELPLNALVEIEFIYQLNE